MSTEQNSDQDNIDQIKYWNSDAGDKWVRFADRLDALLAPFVPLILERVALQTGERALDIGCGGGALSLAAEEKVAPDGGVTGVDVSAPLLELARQRSANAGGNSAFVEADAAQYRSSTPLDAAVSRFGVMFFSDPAAAFSSLRRSLRPEARLVFVCWQGLSENAWARAPLEAAMPHFTKPLPTPDPHAPGPFAFADCNPRAVDLKRSGLARRRNRALDRRSAFARRHRSRKRFFHDGAGASSPPPERTGYRRGARARSA